MVIRKQYNIGQLAEQLQTEVDLDCLMCPCGDKCMKETCEVEGETNE